MNEAKYEEDRKMADSAALNIGSDYVKIKKNLGEL